MHFFLQTLFQKCYFGNETIQFMFTIAIRVLNFIVQHSTQLEYNL